MNRELELEVGGPGAGGVCVARHGERVVLVRHALPGERVRVRVTEDSGGSFCRADAVEILRASADRVPPPCPHAGPGRCGGCDWQHASAPAQRELKGEVVRDQFRRLAGIDVSGVFAGVEELPGGLLGWRTRIAYAVAPDGRVGLRRHRSHEIEPVASCPLGAPGVGDSAALTERWDGLTAVEAVVDDDGAQSLIARRARGGRGGAGTERELLSGPARMRHRLGRRQFQVSTIGFWQVHPHLLAAIRSGLLDALRPRPGETVLELYSGSGPLTAAFGDAVGSTGRVVGIEASRGAVWNARYNLQDLPWASVRRGLVTAARVRAAQPRPDVVVLDPPRAGAGIPVIRAILGRAPRAVGYVSCDPATLARDVRAATDAGWRLTALRAFDAFPMTHHVECLATIEP